LVQDATNLSIKKDKVNQQMADKNLIGGKYTAYLHLLQVFWQKNAKRGRFLTKYSY